MIRFVFFIVAVMTTQNDICQDRAIPQYAFVSGCHQHLSEYNGNKLCWIRKEWDAEMRSLQWEYETEEAESAYYEAQFYTG